MERRLILIVIEGIIEPLRSLIKEFYSLSFQEDFERSLNLEISMENNKLFEEKLIRVNRIAEGGHNV